MFEPAPQAVALLRRDVHLNHLSARVTGVPLGVDTEGYEIHVLRGCAGLIGRRPDVVLVRSLHPWHLQQLGEAEESFFEAATALGLNVFDLDGRETGPAGLYREVVLGRQVRS